MTSTARAAAPRVVAAAARRGVDDLALATLLASRICHDLVGPIGALGAGAELVSPSSDAETRGHALRLMVESAASARARLQFYRAAFGLGGGYGDTIEQDEIAGAARDWLAAVGRVSLDWRVGDTALEHTAARLLMNLVIVASEALPRGGRLRVAVTAADRVTLMLLGEGPSVRFGARARRLLLEGDVEAGEDPIAPKEAPMILAQRLAAQIGARLELGEQADRVMIAAAL